MQVRRAAGEDTGLSTGFLYGGKKNNTKPKLFLTCVNVDAS